MNSMCLEKTKNGKKDEHGPLICQPLPFFIVVASYVMQCAPYHRLF
jgi:hypothetical protein